MTTPAHKDPVKIDGGVGNIMVGTDPQTGKTVLMVKAETGVVHLEMSPDMTAKLIGTLAQSLTRTIGDLGKQLAEWIGVG